MRAIDRAFAAWLFGFFCCALLLALTSCGPKVITRDRPVRFDVPVPQACAGVRPVPVRPLREQVPPAAWRALDVRQKAAHVGRQAFDRQTYGEQLAAATAPCP